MKVEEYGGFGFVRLVKYGTKGDKLQKQLYITAFIPKQIGN
jgi:hypothetical protein